ncbi:hypothetical protein A3K73_07005 [Candidatus Pacearchaeota archaeon RBG_13_36_9]|nr:MAG: hypothetical protein A3K73_07005 [Candidatus Pacearchaeota archaeon RBG_13_36_9]
MKIMLDANFLVYCAKQKIDYINEMPVPGEVVVLSSVVAELEKLKSKEEKAKDGRAVFVALQILEKNIVEEKIKVLKTDEKGGDEAIIAEVKEGDIVATMDKELKKKLKGKARILAIKGRKKLELF